MGHLVNTGGRQSRWKLLAPLSTFTAFPQHLLNEVSLLEPGCHPHYSSGKGSTRKFGTLRSTLRRGVTTPRRASLRLKRCGSKQAGMITQSSVAGALSVELEHLKHKHSKQSDKDDSLHRKLDDELQLRAASMKCISSSASSLLVQLESAKELLASNYRIKAYLEKTSRSQLIPSSGTFRDSTRTITVGSIRSDVLSPLPGVISVSNIRIPLMWKDKDYFKNKGNYRRFSVFCLIRVGHHVSTTTLISDVDRSMTDITFGDVINIKSVPHDFQCHLEIYAYEHQHDLSIASTQVKLRKRLSDLSNSAFRRLSRRHASMKGDTGEEKYHCYIERGATNYIAPTFTLLAETTLYLSDAQQKSSSFDLVLNGEASQLLPIFGNFMCDFSARCDDLILESVKGYMSVKGTGEDLWTTLWCSLSRGKIDCWRSQIEAHISSPQLTIPVMKESVIRKRCEGENTFLTIDNTVSTSTHSFSAGINVLSGQTNSVDKWWQALQQFILNQVVWGMPIISDQMTSNLPYLLRRKTTSL